MRCMTNDSNLRPYDREEWLKIANQFLLDANMSSSALESAYIALSTTDPVISEKLKAEAKYRRIKERNLLNKHK